MNNPIFLKTNHMPRRKGFALLITLSVLAVVIALTAVMMGYLDSAREEASHTRALIQANLYYSDIKKTLMKVKNKNTLYNMLYRNPLSLQSKDGRFSVVMTCSPQANGVNVNWLGRSNDMQMQKQYTAAQKVFDALMEEYDIVDPSRLKEILIQSMAKSGSYRSADRQSRFYQKNGIISYQQFMQLLEQYQFEVDDPNIGRIAWSDYFVFQPVKKGSKNNMINGDYLSVPLISLLFDVDPASVKEIWSSSQGALKKLTSEYGLKYDPKLFTEKVAGRAKCEVSYAYEDKTYRFIFNDIDGEVKDFAFYGK